MDLFQQQADTSNADSLNKGWENINVKIYYTTLTSNIHRKPDSSLQHFHHIAPVYPWWGVDLGNYGSAAHNVLFSPLNMQPGLSSGYHVYDLYKIHLDSLRFYNTTNPYSDFSFILGSKNQQIVTLTHTQNIKPNWNFGANIRSGSSNGFFSGQTAKNISCSLNTNYISPNQRYNLKAAFIYNRFTQDENGGIVSDSFLSNENFNDRSLIPINIPVVTSGADKSIVNNIQRDLDFYVQNGYSWGQVDTTYNKDSTSQKVRFIPRFGLQHVFRIHSEKHQYNDNQPDSIRYAEIAPLTFGATDTLNGRQKWNYVLNSFSLNGFLGKNEHLLALKAGIGNRIDFFSSLTPVGNEQNNSFNTFIFGQIRKEAFSSGQWNYDAKTQFYITGPAIGDFNLNLNLEKQISDWAGFSLGFSQNLTHAPFIYEQFSSNYFDRKNNFNKESITKLYAGLTIPKLKLNVNANYLLITNYLYFNNNLQPQQDNSVQPLLQIQISKPITFYRFTLDNRILYQQNQSNGIINVPKFMFQEQLYFKNDLFKSTLHVLTGIEVRYASPYFCNGYSPLLNQFYHQESFKTQNVPQLGAFFNFSLHHFRAFFALNQIQQLLYNNNINAPGYPAENLKFNFGFSWVLIN